MSLLDKVKALCAQNDTTLAGLEKALGFGNGTISKWDTAAPSGDRLSRVADYFGVTVDYLLGRRETMGAADIGEVYLSLARDAQNAKLDPEDVRLILDTVKKLRARGRNGS